MVATLAPAPSLIQKKLNLQLQGYLSSWFVSVCLSDYGNTADVLVAAVISKKCFVEGDNAAVSNSET